MPEPVQQGAAVIVGLGIIGFDLDGTVVALQRRLRSIELIEQHGAVEVSLGIRGLDRQSTIVVGQRRIPTFQRVMYVAALEIGVGKIGIELNGAAVAGQRGIPLVVLVECRCPVKERQRMIGVGRHGSTDQFGRLHRISRLSCDDCQ